MDLLAASLLVTCDERSRRRGAALRTAACLSLLAFLSSVAVQVRAQGQPGALKIVGPARLTLDPVCNAREGAGLDLLIRNDGSAAVPLSLSVADLTPKTAGKVALATVAVTSPEDRAAADETSLEPKKTRRVRVGLKGTLDSGEWDIELRNGGIAVGTLSVLNPQAAFGVKIDSATPDSPELSFQRGKPATIPLKNGDGFNYRVIGEYSVRGVVQKAEQALSLPANGGGELTLTPPESWFVAEARTLFKDDVADGRLTLTFVSDNCRDDAAAPVRVSKVKTTLAAWPPDTREVYANGVLLIALVLGGICSLGLNFILPAQDSRRKASAQLLFAARRIEDIPIETDTRVRNTVAVERRHLAEQLRRLSLIDGRFSMEMAEIERALARLAVRLDLLGQMQLVLNRYWRQRSVIVSDEIEDLRIQLINLLKQSDPADNDIEAARALIKKIDEQLASASANAANPGLAARLARQAGALKKKFDRVSGPVGTSPVWTNQCAELARELDRINAAPGDPKDIEPAAYAPLARAVFMLEQIGAFIESSKTAGPDGTLGKPEQENLEALMQHLRAGGWDRLKRAERLIRKIGQNIFFDQVAEEIKAKRLIIESSRPVVRQFEPTEFRIVFLDRKVHGSAAREEITCSWEFKHPKQTVKVTSTSWSVSHFFVHATMPESEPEAGRLRKFANGLREFFGMKPVVEQPTAGTPYTVNVTFVQDDGKKVFTVDQDGKEVPCVITDEVPVRPPLEAMIPSSTWTEALRLVLALGIALIGLIAGAREQILKLDVLPALIAVFLLGFGSDRIKNIFTQRAPSPEEAKPPKSP